MVSEDIFNHFVCTSTRTNGRLRCDLLSVVFHFKDLTLEVIRLLLYMWLLARRERERERERESEQRDDERERGSESVRVRVMRGGGFRPEKSGVRICTRSKETLLSQE